MKLLLFFLVVGIATSGKQIWDYRKYLKEVQNFEEEMKIHLSKTAFPKKTVIGNTVVAALCLLGAVLVYVKPELTKGEDSLLYVGFFVVLALMVFTLNFTGKQKKCLYYTEDGFYHDGKLIRFKSVKSLKLSKSNVFEREVVLYNKETVKMDKALAEFVLDKANVK